MEIKQKSRLGILFIVLAMAAGHFATDIFYNGVKDGGKTAHTLIKADK